MRKIVEKALKTGYGLGLLSVAGAGKIVSKIKKDFNLDHDESVRLARKLVETSGAASQEVLTVVGKRLEKALAQAGFEKSDLATVRRMAKRKIVHKLGLKESAFQRIKQKVSRRKK